MSRIDTASRVCDYDKNPIPEGHPVFTLSGSIGVVNAAGDIGASPTAPGGVSGDFCSMAHAIAYAQGLPEFSDPIV